ncbi:hypothetical protein ACLB2K_068543 [Fragaria x ananassa]
MDLPGRESGRGRCWSVLGWRRAVTGAGGWRTDGRPHFKQSADVRFTSGLYIEASKAHLSQSGSVSEASVAQAVLFAPGCAAHLSISAVHFEKVKSPRQMDGGDGRNALNPEEAKAMVMQYQEGTAKHPQNELIGDDEAKLASLEAKLQAITKRIASMEANYF